MKRFLNLLLVLALLASLVVCTASAAPSDDYKDNQGAEFTVKYTAENTGGIRPEATFSYTVSKVDQDAVAGESGAPYPSDLPSVGQVVFGPTEIQNNTTELVAAINLPIYTQVGTYEYIIRQDKPTQPVSGVVYYDHPIHLKVTVIEDAYGKIRVAAVRCGAQDDTGTKQDEISNIYQSGQLSITKTVTGNMGDQEQYFDVDVRLTGPADGTKLPEGATVTIGGGSNPEGQPTAMEYGTPATIKIKHDDTVILSNVLPGTTYTVTEADYTLDDGTAGQGYDDPDYEYSNKNEGSKSITAGRTDTVGITNNKGVTVDTGISLDNAPYLVLLAVVLVAGVLLIMKRRNREKD